MRGTTLLAAAAACLLALAPAGAQGEPQRDGTAWLGVRLANGKYGAKIDVVYRGTPADLARMRAGDEVLSIDGERIRSYRALTELIQKRREIGDEITIKLLRDRRTRLIRAVLGAKPSQAEMLRQHMVGRQAPPLSLPRAGDSGRGDLEDHRGDVVLVAFVSVHCRNCSEVFDALSRLSRRHGEEGLVVLAVTRDSAADLQPHLQAPRRFQLLRGAQKSWFQPRIEESIELPMLYVIDRDGVVRWVGRDLGEMHNSVKMALRERNGVAID